MASMAQTVLTVLTQCVDSIEPCDRTQLNGNVLTVGTTRFVLSRQVLICIGNYGGAWRGVPFNPDSWSRVRDHFGDHFVRRAFRVCRSWYAGARSYAAITPWAVICPVWNSLRYLLS
jgi:hypothetical protein